MSQQTISGLNGCKQLKKLLLYDNRISKIENISHLEQLNVLWLNNNKISKIEVYTDSNLKFEVYTVSFHWADITLAVLKQISWLVLTETLDRYFNWYLVDMSGEYVASSLFKVVGGLQSKQNAGMLEKQQGYLFHTKAVIPHKTSQQAHA